MTETLTFPLGPALCRACGHVMDVFLRERGDEVHPSCEEPSPFGSIPGEDPLKLELMKIITWADSNAPRSLQANIGPSEIGADCARRIAYRLANVPQVNFRMDPWPAIVGTAIHKWLENAVNKYQQHHNTYDFKTETRVTADGLMGRGSSDLYKASTQTVIDHKSAGTDVMKAMIGGKTPPAGYIRQIMIYGMGYVNAGYPVKDVALVFYPRAGRLRDIHVWRGRYDPQVAQDALDRAYGIANQCIELGLPEQGHMFEEIIPTPDDGCYYCKWFKNKEVGLGADETGCPGRD